MTLNTLLPATAAAAAGLALLTFQPVTGHAHGLTTDVERQACHPARVRAIRANRQARAGEISQAERRAFWISYRDCLGSKDKNYLLPAEFKYK
ncbi:MAG: hypothetical protein HKN11_10230 [Rhizobiales bacterium]|nr:hypothetical protein [Hyphomicrobiales bacterium]